MTHESTQPNLATELLRASPLILPCNHLFRDVDIWMPDMEQQEVPAGWWDGEADRSLLAGVFKHGIFCFNLSETDVSRSFFCLSCLKWPNLSVTRL